MFAFIEEENLSSGFPLFSKTNKKLCLFMQSFSFAHSAKDTVGIINVS